MACDAQLASGEFFTGKCLGEFFGGNDRGKRARDLIVRLCTRSQVSTCSGHYLCYAS